MNRWLFALSALLLLANVGWAQVWQPALARPAPTCWPGERLGGERLQLFWQRDRPIAPYGGDLEIRDILLQWPGVLRRLDRLELGLRADPYLPRVPLLPRADPYGPPLGLDPWGPRVDPLCPRCPPVLPEPRVDPYGPRVDPYLPVPRGVDPYLPRDWMPPVSGQVPHGYQRYQGAHAVRR